MTYTEQQINNRITSIKKRYTNFKQLTFRKQIDSDIYFIAIDLNEHEYYLRLKSDGKLFHQLDGKWNQVHNFLYHEVAEQ